MTSTLLISLVTAHLLGDFVLQSQNDVANKNKLWVLLKHAGIIAVLSYLLVGVWPRWEILVIIWLTHVAIDWLKAGMTHNGPLIFLFDQVLHISVILGVVALENYWLLSGTSFWLRLWGLEYSKALILVSGLILCVRFGAFFIDQLIKPFQRQQRETTLRTGQGEMKQLGFEEGGRVIGQLERALIFLLFLIGQPGGVGFLVAAKSVLRLGEVTDKRHRMDAEYIIIGTLMSFGWGILIAHLTGWMLQAI